MPSFHADFDTNSSEITLSEEETHHASNVFRHKIGDIISLINGKGLKANAIIKSSTKKNLILDINQISHSQIQIPKAACAFSLLKNKHDLLIIEKLTELGVSDLFPLTTKHSVKLSGENTIEKMKKTALAAAKQCDNAWIPEIHKVNNITNSIDYIISKGYIPIIASETMPDLSLFDIIKHNDSTQGYCIIIGPEGGFDPSEFELFQKKNIPQVSISKNILRAETAAICATSQIMLCYSLLNP